MVTTTTPHIWLDEQSRAWIDDTNVKVIEVALDHLAYGWSAEEMQRQHPDFSMAQAYAALAYYYDHKAEFDRQIDKSLRRAESLANEAGDLPLLRRLRAAGKL
jgi:uncharacterized protein (DUF433 family)